MAGLLIGCGGGSGQPADAGTDATDTADANTDAEPDGPPGSGQQVEIVALGVGAPVEVTLSMPTPQTKVVTEDGTFRFPFRVDDGTYPITIATPACRLGAPTVTVAGAKATVQLVCDRVVELSAISLDLAFSPTVAYAPGFDRQALLYSGQRAFLIEASDPIDVVATASYPAAGTTITINGVSAVSGMVKTVTMGTAVDVALVHPSGLARSYSFGMTGQFPMTQEATQKASSPADGDRFSTVALGNDTLAVGAPDAEASGSVYVLQRSERAWSEVVRLTPMSPVNQDGFGAAVAIDGDTIVVGAPGVGVAHVFVRMGSTWQRQQILTGAAADRFGTSVGVSGDTIVVGAPQHDATATNSGAAFVFTRSGSTWSQQGSPLEAQLPRANDAFGTSIAISGSSIIVGAPLEDGAGSGVNPSTGSGKAESGAAYVFVRVGTAWSQQVYLKGSNSGADDRFGTAVGISNNTVVVGAPNEDSNGSPTDNTSFESGAAYTYDRSGTTWTSGAYLKASNIVTSTFFGSAVAIDRNHLIVGSAREISTSTGLDGIPNQNGVGCGAAYLFRRGASWAQLRYVKASNTSTNANFGASVTIDGDTFAVGAPKNDFATDTQGEIYIYR